MVWLAVEAEAVYWLDLLFFLVRGANEGKLDVRVKIGRQVLEWQLELLDALSLFYSEAHKLRPGGLVVQLLHALDSGVIQEAKEEHLQLARDRLCQSLHGLVRDVFLHLCASIIVSHLDVDEADNPSLESILWSFDNNYELLLHLWPNFYRDCFLKLLGDRILNEPAIELNFGIFDKSAILVREWKLLTVVLAEDGVTVERLLARDVHSHNLVFLADVAQQKC